MIYNLKEFIKVNDDFKNAINLYLNLNKGDKILKYIPTISSLNLLALYLESVDKNKSQSTMLIGPYGKGKSHLLLVLLAIISMKRNHENTKLIESLVDKISLIDKSLPILVNKIWQNKPRFLPVIISSTYGDLKQSFLIGLNDALKREGLNDLMPDTFFSYAIDNIKNWQKNYESTFFQLKEKVRLENKSYDELLNGLKNYDKDSLNIFRKIYPELTSGSQFNPLVNSEILPIYKSISDKLVKENYSGIYIVFDEFSKFIEGIDNKNSGNDMKLLQDICELAQDSKEAQIHITFVAHKSLKEYGKYISKDIINSYTGIEGRIEERYFITSTKNNYELIKNAISKDEDSLNRVPIYNDYFNNERINSYYNVPVFKSMFNEDDFKKIIMKGCYPLSPISSYLLLNISEKVAQNERTLFTFISKDEPLSMARFIKNHSSDKGWVVHPDMIYDYFKNLFRKDLSNEFVHSEWLKADYSISNAKTIEQTKVLKTLAIINIVNKPDELPANDKYLALSSGIDNAYEIIDELVNENLIYKKSSNEQYFFKSRIGTDLKIEIKRRRELLDLNKINIGSIFESISNTNVILPKKYNQDYFMTRYFINEYIKFNDFINIDNDSAFFGNTNFCDGKVLSIIFAEEDSSNSVKSIIDKLKSFKNERLILLLPSMKFSLNNIIKDYTVLQEIKNDVPFLEDNKVLINELNIFEEDIIGEIYKYLRDAYKVGESKAFYYYNEQVMVWNTGNINSLVDEICFRYYNKTPIINNELINKQFINTSPIKKARKSIIEYILNNNRDEAFYSGTSPEATIFRALFVNTGVLSGKSSDNMQEFLSELSLGVSYCNENKISLKIILNKVGNAPYGVRNGVLPVFLAYIISNISDDLVVYFNTKEVQLSPDIIVNMCEHPEDYYIYISAKSYEKDQYIEGLLKAFPISDKDNTRISNILIGMQRWFRALPQVTRNFKTKNELFKDNVLFDAMILIKPLLQKVDTNPYEIIFEKIPSSFGLKDDYYLCFEYIKQFKLLLEEHLQWLIEKAVSETIKVFGKENSQDGLYHILKDWYEKQSVMSKKGIYSNRITNFMNYISEFSTYDDTEIVQKVIRSVTDVYIENWNDNSLDDYIESIKEVKSEIESIKGDNHLTMQQIILKNGEIEISKFYNNVDENTGVVFRNIIEDTINDFTDLNANDKVAILVEMIEKVIKSEV